LPEPFRADLKSQITDLENLLSVAKHASNQSFLKTKLSDCKTKLAAIPVTASATEDKKCDTSQSMSVPAATNTSTSTPPPPPKLAGLTYTPINNLYWDQGSYGSKHEGRITVYLDDGLEGVGKVKDRVTCEFTKDSFDLKICGLDGKNFRIVQRGLEKDIIPAQCRHRVKKNKVLVYLAKKKGEYGYDNWTELVAKRKRKDLDKGNPSAGINDMIQDLYNSGDDQMKKTIGEAMMKARQGKTSTPALPDDF